MDTSTKLAIHHTVNSKIEEDILLRDNIQQIKTLMEQNRIDIKGKFERCNNGNIWRLLACPEEHSKTRRLKLLDFLLSHYLDTPNKLNEFDNNGLAPIHSAALNGYIDIIKLFVDYGADPTLPINGQNRVTPLEIIKEKKYKFASFMQEIIDHYEKDIKPKLELDPIGFLKRKQATEREKFDVIKPNDKPLKASSNNIKMLPSKISHLFKNLSHIFNGNNSEMHHKKQQHTESSAPLMKKNQ